MICASLATSERVASVIAAVCRLAVAGELHGAHHQRVGAPRGESDDERGSVDPTETAERLLRGARDDVHAQVQQHQQVAQVAGEEGHLVGARDQHFLGADDRLDQRVHRAARDLAGGVLDVQVVGRERRLELVLVEREQRRRGSGHRRCRLPWRPWRSRAGIPRGPPPGARGSPRSRAPGRSARRWSSTCWRGGRAPRRSGRRPRRGGRRCTGPRPSASASTRRSAPGCTWTGSGARWCRRLGSPRCPERSAVLVAARFIGAFVRRLRLALLPAVIGRVGSVADEAQRCSRISTKTSARAFARSWSARCSARRAATASGSARGSSRARCSRSPARAASSGWPCRRPTGARAPRTSASTW